MAKKIDPLLPKIFKVFPRAPYGVIPIPEESAPSQQLHTTMDQLKEDRVTFMQIFINQNLDLNMKYQY